MVVAEVFGVGDVVRTTWGGPEMTVFAVLVKAVMVRWVVGGDMFTATLPQEHLVLVKRRYLP